MSEVPIGESETSQLSLCISHDRVGLYPPVSPVASDQDADAAYSVGPPAETQGLLVCLQGRLSEFRLFATNASQWLIDIAHDLFDPREKRGTLYILDDPSGAPPHPVIGSDPLHAATYEYRVGAAIRITKISQRHSKSKSRPTGNAGRMREEVIRRDGSSWISRVSSPVSNSHICPKRLGDYQARILFADFVGSPPPGLTIFDPMFGLLLNANEVRWFESFEIGFWHDPSEPGYQLIVHDFTADQNVRVGGFVLPIGERDSLASPVHVSLSLVPLVHRYLVSPPRPDQQSLPPLGLLRWHYLQCVIKKFKTDALENVPNISHFELPFRTEDDDDDSGTDSDFEWPSAVFDRGRALVQEEEAGIQRMENIRNWIALQE
ncbi:hypothetical protein PQX77_013488 [Marasmius sp. AFHP31]|nr:hypothetical protein PQX77_013488 [Marasmius sp. AFHP31]